MILDSPAYMDCMCTGIAKSVTEMQLLRSAIINSLQLYLAAFPRSVTHHYQESQRIFHHNQVPTLILYSDIDEISSAQVSERYASEWKTNGYQVMLQKFTNTPHVGHYRQFPMVYKQALYNFINQLALPVSCVESKEEVDKASRISPPEDSTDSPIAPVFYDQVSKLDYVPATPNSPQQRIQVRCLKK